MLDFIVDSSQLSFLISGLCGAVHTGVARSIRADLNENADIKVICVGDKSRAILQRLYSKNILIVANEVIIYKWTYLNLNLQMHIFLDWTFASYFLGCGQARQPSH